MGNSARSVRAASGWVSRRHDPGSIARHFGRLAGFRRVAKRRWWRSSQGQSSTAAFVPKGFPLLPVERAGFEGGGAGADAGGGLFGFLSAVCAFGGHQAGHGLAVAGDENVLALLDEFEQGAELVFGFESADFFHQGCVSEILGRD